VPLAREEVTILTSTETVSALFVRVPDAGMNVVMGKRTVLFSALATYTRFQLRVLPLPRPVAFTVMNLSIVVGPNWPRFSSFGWLTCWLPSVP